MILYNAAEMRDNMEQTTVLALGPEQHQLQLQQQHHHQQASLVGGGHFLHPTTIPVSATIPWSSVAHIKSEPLDKHDDSGISHGHYASDSASPESLQSPLGSDMSPGSSGSQDSTSLSAVDYNNLGVESNGGCIDEHLDSSSRSLYSRCQISPVLLKCPICGFADMNRLTFTDHLREHCSTVSKIGEDEFTRLVMEQLTNSKKPSICSNAEEGFAGYERGIEFPCISSHGKVKIIYCKSCPAIFITKVDFWLHGRVHSRPGKRMDCPSCDFSTEFKHHLEYHLCNHLGSKPYKCDKCPYACVNKSMLNSHMKSHSNVYQFRCADCPYATKYCHALKLHLRKYGHTSAPVLNPDGSLNPDVVIDVYGKKRGPKPKSKLKAQKSRAEEPAQPEPAQPQVAALGQSYQFGPIGGLANMASFGAFPGLPALMGFPFNQLLGHVPMASLYPASGDCARQQTSPSRMDCSEDGGAAPGEEDGGGSSPLDLSANCKPQVAAAASHPQTEVGARRIAGTSRRKGRTRRVPQSEPAEGTSERGSPPTPPLSSPDSLDSKVSDRCKSQASGDFACQHCNISFGHEIMHLVHMAYHDRDDPFKCKKCGARANDSVSFFLHIVSNKH